MRQRAAQIGVVFHDFPLGGSERIAIRLMNRRAESGRKVVAFCGAVRGPLVDLIDREADVVECAPAIPRAPSVVTQISTPLHRHGRGPIEQFAYNLLTRHRLRNRDAPIALSPSVIGQADDVLDRQITQYIRLPVLDDTLHPRTLTASRPGVAGRVELVGYVPDISPWLRQARLLLLSSYYEGFGAVLVEALATGRPVVSTDCTPAIKDTLIRLPGCLVAPIGDHIGMAGCARPRARRRRARSPAAAIVCKPSPSGAAMTSLAVAAWRLLEASKRTGFSGCGVQGPVRRGAYAICSALTFASRVVAGG